MTGRTDDVAKKKSRKYQRLTESDIKMAWAERNAGRTYAEIAKLIGCGPDAVRRQLLKRGLAGGGRARKPRSRAGTRYAEAQRLIAQAERYAEKAERARAKAIKLLGGGS